MACTDDDGSTSRRRPEKTALVESQTNQGASFGTVNHIPNLRDVLAAANGDHGQTTNLCRRHEQTHGLSLVAMTPPLRRRRRMTTNPVATRSSTTRAIPVQRTTSTTPAYL